MFSNGRNGQSNKLYIAVDFYTQSQFREMCAFVAVPTVVARWSNKMEKKNERAAVAEKKN